MAEPSKEYVVVSLILETNLEGKDIKKDWTLLYVPSLGKLSKVTIAHKGKKVTMEVEKHEDEFFGDFLPLCISIENELALYGDITNG